MVSGRKLERRSLAMEILREGFIIVWLFCGNDLATKECTEGTARQSILGPAVFNCVGAYSKAMLERPKVVLEPAENEYVKWICRPK